MNIRKVGKDILFDYTGMNPAVAKLFGFEDIADDEILVLEGLSPEEEKKTIEHEIEEDKLVSSGESYWSAHTRLLKQGKSGGDSMVTKTDTNVIRKSMPITIRKGKDGNDEICISTPNYDRGNDRVFPSGAVLDNYNKNPIIMWLHDYHGQTASAGIPVGKCPYLKVNEEGIIAGPPIFLEGDPFADRVKNAWDKGFLRTASIGFAPIESEPNDKGGYDYTKWELLEWSFAPIPMNAEACRIAKSQGFEDLVEKVITKPEVTENYIRIPVEPADKHKDHRIRTIDISAKDGIKALYCGECKVVITYLFDKDKWSTAEAEKWVKEHEKSAILPETKISQAELADDMDYLLTEIQQVGISESSKEIAIKLLDELKRLTGGDTPDDIKQIQEMLNRVFN